MERTRRRVRKDRRVAKAGASGRARARAARGEWDSQTVATWMQDNIKSALARFVMRAGIWAISPLTRRICRSYTCSSTSALAEASRSLHKSGLAVTVRGGARQVVSDRVAQSGRPGDAQNAGAGDRFDGKMIVVKTDQGRFRSTARDWSLSRRRLQGGYSIGRACLQTEMD